MAIFLPTMPESIANLPRDERGYPVPWFVAWIDGKPEFRVADGRKWRQAVKHGLCWVCGMELEAKKLTFVIGPMCAINKTTAEPPCHYECAVFSAMACPFLAKPKAVRREANMPAEAACAEIPGVGISRNPGVTCLWTCASYEPFKVPNGELIRIGNPSSVRWYAEGRKATRAEILESIETGLPLLRGMAEQQCAAEHNREASDELDRMVKAAMKLVPAA